MPFPPITVTDEQFSALQDKLRNKEIDPTNPNVLAVGRHFYSSRLLTFAKTILPEHVQDQRTHETTPFSSMHVEFEQLLLDDDHRRLAIAAPRGHAKSTFVSFFFILHAALYQRAHNIIILSATEDLAIRFLRTIKAELEYNPRIKALFGDMKSPKWSETEIVLANGVAINARGRGAQIRGLKHGQYRPDLIVLDDLEDDELVRSEIRRKDMEDWFNGTVIPTLDPSTGRLIIIGTILHQDSLLNKILTSYSGFTSRKYAALLDDDTPLWPERFSKDFLTQVRKEFMERHKLPQFFMEYMNDPTPADTAFFNVDDWTYFDKEATLKTLGAHVVEVAVDLGGGSVRREADDTAIVVGATSINESKMKILECFAMQVGTDTDIICNKLFQINADYHPQKFIIEKTVATNFLLPSLTQQMQQRGIFLPIQLVTPPRGTGAGTGNMSDAKFQRISALVQPVKNTDIQILPEHTKLISQSASFPRAKHDDLLDALAYLWMFGFKAVKQTTEQEDQLNDLPYMRPLYEDIGI